MYDKITFYCKVCCVDLFPFTSLSNCEFVKTFKDIDDSLAQLIYNVKSANLDVLADIYKHEYVQNMPILTIGHAIVHTSLFLGAYFV